ncbi:hypothetical protein ABK040_006995 [Willaertia magna]
MSKLKGEQEPTKQSALCIVIPKENELCEILDLNNKEDEKNGFDHIQNIRQKYDKSFSKWEPHMNLLYPFVHKKFFFKAKRLIEQMLINNELNHAFEVTLPAHDAFCKTFSKFVLSTPKEEKQLEHFQKLYKLLREIFPQCKATGQLTEEKNNKDEHTFEPHLTLGQITNSAMNLNNDAKELKEIQQLWRGIKFQVVELVFLWRESQEDPFHITETIPLVNPQHDEEFEN